MSIEELPEFIPQSIVGVPVDFRWEGAREHIGPTETVTPLFERLGGTTTCGQISMCSGILLWGAWRLKGHAPVEHNFELAQASFAYQIDWRYVDIEVEPKGKAPDQPPALSAMMKLNSFLRASLRDYWNSYYIPISETFHSAHIVKHILPAEHAKAFQHWLVSLADRVKSIAAKPDEPFRKKKEFDTADEYEVFVARHRGLALPPEILNPAQQVTAGNREELVARFLERLDWKSNRYLRAPEKMQAMGFTGTPYRLF